MSIRITGRHHADTEEIQACVEKKLSRLSRILGKAQSISLMIDRDSDKAYVLEMLFKHGIVETRARAKDQQYTVAVDKLIEKIEKQVLRTMDRLRGKSKRNVRTVPTARSGEASSKESAIEEFSELPDSLAEVAANFQLPIVEPIVVKALKRKVYPAVVDLTPLMNVEEAATAMHARESTFMVFRNSDAEKRRSIMFRRPDGHFGLLEI